MRRPLIAGNWKMNLDHRQAVDLAQGVSTGAGELAGVDLAVCPPSVYLAAVAGCLDGGPVGLGGQDMYYESSGAFTGEISGAMLVDCGCQYVILGHSERRHILGETDELVHRKVVAALADGLVPILCVGELLEEREAGQTREVVDRQLRGGLADLSADAMGRVVLAYEPVWAIGTGKVATPEMAEEVHADLRKRVEEDYNAGVAAGVRILYGGSVKPDNAADLMARPNVDGALVGGASLSAESFLAIAAASQR